jgi:hypothetical protein
MGKKSAPPPPPNYEALAQQQAALSKAAAEEQTAADRPNQFTPWGSSTWEGTKDADGKPVWNQTVTLDPAEQAALDQQRQFNTQQQGMASGLLDQAQTNLSTPLDLSGLPELKDFDFSKLGEFGSIDTAGMPQLGQSDYSKVNDLDAGFGGVESIRDAMMGRMAPARSQLRESEINRLKAQGLPENGEAFQRAMKRLDEGDTDAEQQALLASMTAYGDIFNRGLAENNQNIGMADTLSEQLRKNRSQQFGEQLSGAELANKTRSQQMSEQDASTRLAGLLRQQSLTEQQQLRSDPLDNFQRLTQGTNPSMPQMPSFMGAASYQPANIYGAAKDTYDGQVGITNAKNAATGGQNAALGTLATAAAIFF